METGLNPQAIRKALDAESWEPGEEEGTERRAVYLGTVFNLTPSGKYYLPFACSNVAGCVKCGGKGSLPRFKRKSLQRRRERAMERRSVFLRTVVEPLRKAGKLAQARDRQLWYGWRWKSTSITCDHCGGLGSREAFLDEQWRAAADSEMEAIGASLENGEGDPCDLLVVEYRAAEDYVEDQNRRATDET